MAAFFIDRPIFAWVLAIVVMLAGIAAVLGLPLERYPDIAPTRISINTSYPGASAKAIEDSVTQVIEQNLKGIDGLFSIESTSNASGGANTQLSFVAGTDPDLAQMQVQNKVSQSLSRLPQAVQAQGVRVTKAGSEPLMVVMLTSDDPNVSSADLGDYLSSTLQDIISRIEGVGDINVFGSGYAMRIWLDPARLQRYALVPGDIRNALLAQNTEVSAGQLGAQPVPEGQRLTAIITARAKLQTPEQFRNIVLRVQPDGSALRLKDVARVELGRDSYTTNVRSSGVTAAGMAIVPASGANALKTAELVKAKFKELEPFFPHGMKVTFTYDTTPFISVSIEGVVHTLIEAMVLVVVIMYLFMQNLRATLVPAIAVPVVLLGTFGVLALAGYSINTLTMFGLVLAIGLLVDDAIVVVENVERLMREEGLSPRDATRASMKEISGALVGIAVVLSAVFIPMAFFGGSTGVIYRQFSITVVSAMVLSVLVAMSLSPALCATLLKPVHKGEHAAHGGPFGKQLDWFFGGFNCGFDRFTERYVSRVRWLTARGVRGFMVYLLLIAGLAALYKTLPTSFLPDEDQGGLQIQVRMAPGATAERMEAVAQSIEAYLADQKEVQFYNIVRGAGGDQGSGQGFIRLTDWSARTGKAQGAGALAERFSRELGKRVRDANIFVVQPPTVRGLGGSAGIQLFLQDLGGVGSEALIAARDRLIDLANQRPELSRARTNSLTETPQLQIDIDDHKAGTLGVTTSTINDTLSIALGSSYVNDFLDRGRVKRVLVQGEGAYRADPEALRFWYVRNASGEMVSFSAFAKAGWTNGPRQLVRYNGSAAYEIQADVAPGVSSGAAMAAMEQVLREMPPGIGFEWSGRSYQERLSGDQAPMLYAVSVLFIFLCLAALYESWSVPFSVMLVVPLGIIGALAASHLGGQMNDVFFQVGLLTTVGLSAKNAILIVEFAETLLAQGMGLLDATLKACRQRLRPILMTSLAFMMGVLPLAYASGAGSGSQRAIGVGVLGGMGSATLLGIFFVPLFYLWVKQRFSRMTKTGTAGDAGTRPTDEGHHAAGDAAGPEART
ncbi:hydrophobe/amphiphile efflux-1 (HAE1) family protein [Mitsuaria sp. BK045]|uniref:efflux RND transporter permease subunit n=1 Tax=unclassified Roseateles TaxID=2626991 RepID=UPI00161AD8A3|nr:MULTISPECIES: efflux RND transporter permease subunit [unclassified Roseateles]MBB3293621.1 hydrophobe/amphiphile efflux-1 (HAE1) family protein [Mitsuaria sp. BK041]MBB3362838.1 hydrophobe/amphiphile efflux-1 (HAE1) family protein [Mitsuaria sp. BK045]